MEAVISARSDKNWKSQITKAMPIGIRMIDRIKAPDHSEKELVEIKTHGADQKDVLAAIKAHRNVKDVEIEGLDGDRLFAIVTLRECMGCKALESCDCFPVSCTSTKEGFVNIKIIFSDRKAVQDLVWTMKKEWDEVNLIRIANIRDEEMLTEKQEQMIQTAFKRGYYDFPKRVGIKELSEMFQVSTATLSEILRRGQRKIIEKYFEKNETPE
ncbi:MAG: helix-turn-helix domain-containing protein [Euryarchaeota archaeon]|nr:helix-turn-helix domain-containing protein [Euryarchaeota archaeon]